MGRWICITEQLVQFSLAAYLESNGRCQKMCLFGFYTNAVRSSLGSINTCVHGYFSGCYNDRSCVYIRDNADSHD